MSIEAGARAGLVAPDEKTFEFLRGKKYVPKNYDELVNYWHENLKSDTDAHFDKRFTLHADKISPQVSWGTNPAMTTDVTGTVPFPEEYSKGNPDEEKAALKALQYMDLKPGTQITDISLDRIFIGSCTNSRLGDLIEASKVIKGNKIASNVRAMVVPGSQLVKKQAEQLGLDKIFKDAGFEWREDRKSTRLNSSHDQISYAVFC